MMGSGVSTRSELHSVDDVYDQVDSSAIRNNIHPLIPLDSGIDDNLSFIGKELSIWVIRVVAFNKRRPGEFDPTLNVLCGCVKDILEKNKEIFDDMVNRIEVTSYTEFCYVADELFEAKNNSAERQITWGRVVALFAFAVRLSSKFNEADRRVGEITEFLTIYVKQHVISFVKDSNGWEGLVDFYALPNPNSISDDQFRQVLIWSGVCGVGLAVMLCISNLLR